MRFLTVFYINRKSRLKIAVVNSCTQSLRLNWFGGFASRKFGIEDDATNDRYDPAGIECFDNCIAFYTHVMTPASISNFSPFWCDDAPFWCNFHRFGAATHHISAIKLRFDATTHRWGAITHCFGALTNCFGALTHRFGTMTKRFGVVCVPGQEALRMQ